MTTYFIKVILYSAIFIVTYKLLFEKQKMHIFNRLYLLLSLVFSFIIPVISFHFVIPILTISENEIINTNILKENRISAILLPGQSTNYVFLILLAGYIAITTILLVRFFINLHKILFKIRAHQTIQYKNSKIVLLNADLAPHSFLNYLFVNKKEYENGNIENEILIHENAHIRQKHSYDILLMEVLQIVFWFNPFLFCCKRAIKLNHEFLADEAVINSSQYISRYQYLLIDKASKKNNSTLTSQFNYSLTKKRLIMMTKRTSLGNALCRQMAIIPVVALSIFAFSIKSLAQEPLVTSYAPFSKATKVNQSTKFLILVETINGGLKLTGQEGCAWKELTFIIKQDSLQAIDQYGMTTLNGENPKEDKDLSNFLFIIEKTKEGISLLGKRGTAWSNLSFSCLKGQCYQYIDFNGMTEK
jgi:bla regulator protein BlaR1